MSQTSLRFGIGVNVIGIVLALTYIASLVAVGLSGTGFPPVEPFDVIVSLVSLISAPAILAFFAAIYLVTPEERKIFGLLALAFSILFTAMTSINRFVHLAIVRPSMAAGVTEGLDWFTPYGVYSIMVGLEILGWSFFLGLAFLFAAFVFWGNRDTKFLSWTFLVNALLSLASTLTSFTGITAFTFIGAIAWGPGFILAAVLLTGLYRQEIKRSFDFQPRQ